MIDPHSAWVVSRGLISVTLMVTWGCFGFLSWAIPTPLSTAIMRRLAGLSAWCAVVLCLAMLIAVPAQVASISDGWGDIGRPGIVMAFLTLTRSGSAWMFLAGSTLLLILARCLAPARTGVLAGLAGLSLSGFALAGHAAMNDGALRLLQATIDVVHVLSAGAWLGELVAFVFLMQATGNPQLRPLATLALRRFSTLGHIVVAVVFLSGSINTALIVGHFPTDLHSPYQTKLLIKIGLVIMMTLAAITNRYVFVPLLQKGNGRAVSALKAGAIFEIVTGGVALGLVAIFGTEDPA